MLMGSPSPILRQVSSCSLIGLELTKICLSLMGPKVFLPSHSSCESWLTVFCAAPKLAKDSSGCVYEKKLQKRLTKRERSHLEGCGTIPHTGDPDGIRRGKGRASEFGLFSLCSLALWFVCVWLCRILSSMSWWTETSETMSKVSPSPTKLFSQVFCHTGEKSNRGQYTYRPPVPKLSQSQATSSFSRS